MIEYQNTNLCTKFEPPMTSLENIRLPLKMTSFFENMAVACSDNVINSKAIFLKKFGEHQTAPEIWCSNDVWFRS